MADGRIDPRALRIAVATATACLAVLVSTLIPHAVEARARIKGPAEVRVGERVAFRASGLAAHAHFAVSLAPTAHRGGNCCGIDVDRGHTNDRGVAVLRFRWPRHYRNGDDRVRWRNGSRADVIVFGDAGRVIRSVRVRR